MSDLRPNYIQVHQIYLIDLNVYRELLRVTREKREINRIILRCDSFITFRVLRPREKEKKSKPILVHGGFWILNSK